MTTKRLRITDAAIKRHRDNPAIARLRDERYSVELRFRRHRHASIAATWWLIDKRTRPGQPKKARWEKLGTWPQLTAEALFKQLPHKMACLAAGIEDVVTEWTTFADVLTWYLDHVTQSRQITPGRRSAVKSVVLNHLLPRVGTLPLQGVRKHQLKDALIWPLQATYAKRTVKSYFAMLKAAFNQAAREELLASNPLSVIQLSDFMSTKADPNESRLHPPMVAPLLNTLQARPWTERILPLLQLTHATRIRETRLARWSHIDWDERTWRIPAKNAKNGEALSLPLTDQALAMLAQHRQAQPAGALFIVPGSRDGKRPLSKDRANDLYQAISAREWTSHDCRKLARSRLADLGVDKFVGERLLNHKMRDLDQAYIHTTTEHLKREALATYHAWLDTQGFFIFHGKTIGRSKKQTAAMQTAGWL
ncbi:tyrosine-type recombinase/integrase [Vibrio furnissii]|uniref:tyrosine-type recombinase/integrase n=1 Tax=Vibrio furnissii TaxID=29494 RepID=UPI001EEB1721|nr:tyrosine-type recombinase/integrase [Vibrio furnissii]MCG6268293.1 tyrosine-type recombinase/integrase [Vibrio furnissii]